MNLKLIYPRWPKLLRQTEFHLPPHGPVVLAAALPPDVAVTFVDENVEPLDLVTVSDSLFPFSAQPFQIREISEDMKTHVLSVTAQEWTAGVNHSTARVAVREQMARLTTVLQQNIAGVRVVKAFARETYAIGQANGPKSDEHRLVQLAERPLLGAYAASEIAEMVNGQGHVGGQRFTHWFAVVPRLGDRQHLEVGLPDDALDGGRGGLVPLGHDHLHDEEAGIGFHRLHLGGHVHPAALAA